MITVVVLAAILIANGVALFYFNGAGRLATEDAGENEPVEASPSDLAEMLFQLVFLEALSLLFFFVCAYYWTSVPKAALTVVLGAPVIWLLGIVMRRTDISSEWKTVLIPSYRMGALIVFLLGFFLLDFVVNFHYALFVGITLALLTLAVSFLFSYVRLVRTRGLTRVIRSRLWIYMLVMVFSFYFSYENLTASGAFGLFSIGGDPLAPSSRSQVNDHGLRGPAIEIWKAEDTVRIAVFGDSIVYGLMVRDENSFPRIIDLKLNARSQGALFEVINAGVNKMSLLDSIERLRNKVAQFEPDVILLMSGEVDLDFNEEYGHVELLRGFVEQARETGAAIAFCAYPGEIGEKVNPTLREIAKEEGIHYIDLYARLYMEQRWDVDAVTLDGRNPNKDGYALIADEIVNYLLEENLVSLDPIAPDEFDDGFEDDDETDAPAGATEPAVDDSAGAFGLGDEAEGGQ